MLISKYAGFYTKVLSIALTRIGIQLGSLKVFELGSIFNSTCCAFIANDSNLTVAVERTA